MSHKPKVDPSQAENLVSFLTSYIEENNLSIRGLAREVGLSPSYITRIINGEKIPDAIFCKQIADRLNVPQIKIFKLAGWIDEKDQEVALSKLKELAEQDADVQIILNLIEEEPQLKREILTTVLQNLNKWKKNKGNNENQ